METSDKTLEKPNVPTKIVKESLNHHLIFGSIGVVVVVATCAGVYLWQHSKLNSETAKYVAANASLTGANKQLLSEKEQYSTLQSKYNQATIQIKNLQQPTLAPTQSDLKLVVSRAVRYSEYINEVNQDVAVEVSLTNTSKAAINIVTSNFELQDRNNNTYAAGDFGGLPASYVKMKNQTVQAGQTIKGTLMFNVSDTTLNNFLLLNGANTYQVTVH